MSFAVPVMPAPPQASDRVQVRSTVLSFPSILQLSWKMQESLRLIILDGSLPETGPFIYVNFICGIY